MLTLVSQSRPLSRWTLKPSRHRCKNERRSIWSFLKSPEPIENLAELDATDPLISNMSADRMIGSVKRIAPEEFYNKYRLLSQPIIIKGIASGWAAATKWKDPHYFSKNFGTSHVPIEVGGHYLASNWTQKMVSFKDFIEKYITLENKCEIFNSFNLGIPEFKTDKSPFKSHPFKIESR
jgi:hypothetical protein